jgi:hypothetical protein
MRTRYARFASFMTLALLAGFLVIATQAFALPVLQWLTFGIAVATLVLTLGIAAGLHRHLPSAILGGAGATISAWTIVASLVFGLSTVMWLGFAAGIALLAIAAGGLIAHELSTERVVHSFTIGERRSEQVTA